MTTTKSDFANHVEVLERRLDRLRTIENEAVWLAQENDALRFERNAAENVIHQVHAELSHGTITAIEASIAMLDGWAKFAGHDR